jgi:glycosyltransferase involved in cell wall biosynthesis
MSSKKQRILIDVTDFQNWKGHFTGIQRVIYEIGSRLNEGADFEVQSFYYDEDIHQFRLVTNDVFLHHDPDEEPTENDAPITSQNNRLTKIFLDSMPQLPIKALIRTYNVSRHNIGLLKNQVVIPSYRRFKNQLNMLDSQKVEFTKNDTVLILGAGWHKRTMAEYLGKEQEKHGFKVAVLIHDIIPLIKPEFFGIGLEEVYAEFIFEILPMSSVVFAISKATENDILAFSKKYHIPTPHTVLIKEGDTFKRNSQPRKPKQLKDEPYILAVGSFEVRKNYTVLYQAVKQAQLEHISMPKIVIVGRNGWLNGDLKFLIDHDLSLEGKIIHLSNVSDAELGWLYENALFTVYPSIYEGWGLPIAESLFYGKFCLASYTSSMPEVGGKLIEYVSPYDTVEWMRRISYYASEPSALAKMTDRVKKDYKPTSWDSTVSTIVKALK